MKDGAKNSTAPTIGPTAEDVRTRLPPLKALLAFEVAARHGSFAQAAEELAVTPSAISHQIHQLEAFLGVQLFQRHAGRVTLTSAGGTYGCAIERAFALISEATKVVAPESHGGHMVIASGPSFAAKWLQPRLPDFLRAHPDIRVRLSTMSGHDDLETGRFDVAITYGRPQSLQRDSEPLLVEHLRPLCSPVLVEALGLRAIKDLARATLIHSSNALTWVEYLRRAGEVKLRPANELWLDRSTMAIEAAVNGLGVVLESEILAAEELRDGRLVAPFDTPAFHVEATSYFLVKSPDYRNANHVAAFEKWLRAAIASSNLAIKTG
jgi:LysR family glycine cleavage system transcriptional activator